MVSKEYLMSETDFEVLQGTRYTTLIAPSSVLDKVTLDTLIQFTSYPDEVFFDLEHSDLKPELSIAVEYRDVSYIREVRLKDVKEFEWEVCYGPIDSTEFMELYENTDLDTKVKIVCTKQIDYDLKALRRRINKHSGKC